MNFLKWLVPGMHVKRWLVLLFVGVLAGKLGLGLVMAYIYRSVRITGLTSDIVYGVTLQFIPRVDRAIILIALGLVIVLGSLFKLSHSLLSVFLPNPRNLADVIYRTRKLPRGPRIVAIGGGTGLSNLLRGLKEYTSNLTAIVTLADDWSRQNPFRQQEGIVAHPEALQAIMAADMIVLGPGSLYTSVLPSLLVPGIREAIRSSRAVKVFVNNIATKVGDTENMDVLQHVQVVHSHVGDG